MAEILKTDKLYELLMEYYIKNYGQMDTDIWYEQPAANVVVFERDDKFISLQSHILTGKITEHIEYKTK